MARIVNWQILAQTELFRGMTDQQLQLLADITSLQTLTKDDVLCRQGDDADHLYIVQDGEVEVRVRDRSGADEPLLYMGRGQVIGEMTLVDSGRRSATVYASADATVVICVPNADLMALCEEHTDIGFLIMRNIAQDLSFKIRHRDADQSPEA